MTEEDRSVVIRRHAATRKDKIIGMLEMYLTTIKKLDVQIATYGTLDYLLKPRIPKEPH
jgi:hypothetical protein